LANIEGSNGEKDVTSWLDRYFSVISFIFRRSFIYQQKPMSNRPTRQQILQQRKTVAFVGRQRQLELFQNNLDRKPEHPGFQFIFLGGAGDVVSGQGQLSNWRFSVFS
jgi:hypothetical protein